MPAHAASAALPLAPLFSLLRLSRHTLIYYYFIFFDARYDTLAAAVYHVTNNLPRHASLLRHTIC